MGRNRLEAFSDGVLAIVITIMVLELKVPHGAEFAALIEKWHIFVAYVLSFVYIGIYWNNHHHLLHTVEKVSGPILWANLHLLFWLSLLPFATGWTGETEFARAPTVIYGVVLLAAAIAYFILTETIKAQHGPTSTLSRAVGRDLKGKLSPLIYLAGIVIAFFAPIVSNLLYALVALIWLIPDRRIERAIGK